MLPYQLMPLTFFFGVVKLYEMFDPLCILFRILMPKVADRLQNMFIIMFCKGALACYTILFYDFRPLSVPCVLLSVPRVDYLLSSYQWHRHMVFFGHGSKIMR
jgi:hypothetical protein